MAVSVGHLVSHIGHRRIRMTWDAYLILKTAGIAVVIFAGGFSVSKHLPVSRSKAFLINAVAVLAGFSLSRLWYIVQHVYGNEPYEYRSLAEAWNAWSDAGSVLYGWVLGGVFAWILLTRFFKINTIRYLDCVLTWILIAQFLNRLGCWDAGCCYGIVFPAPLCVTNSLVGGCLFPVQLFEAFFDLGLFAFIVTRPKRQGLPTFIYFMGYPIARFILEFFRGDNQPAFLGMTVPQIASILIVATTLLLKKKIFAPTH